MQALADQSGRLPGLGRLIAATHIRTYKVDIAVQNAGGHPALKLLPAGICRSGNLALSAGSQDLSILYQQRKVFHYLLAVKHLFAGIVYPAHRFYLLVSGSFSASVPGSTKRPFSRISVRVPSALTPSSRSSSSKASV